MVEAEVEEEEEEEEEEVEEEELAPACVVGFGSVVESSGSTVMSESARGDWAAQRSNDGCTPFKRAATDNDAT